MEDSKVNEVDSIITPPTPMGMTVHTGPLVNQISLLVADWHNRILGVNLVVIATTILASGGGGLGQVSIPHGIAVDPNTRNIFVTDTGNFRVQKFTPNFVHIKAWGSQGTGDSQFSLATGIAVDSNGEVYVTDTNNHRVQKFDNNGVFIKAWGKKGTGDGEFILPMYIALESDNDIVVTDRDN
jgi:DNA-binding beta-propeller fold protein YncE